MMEHSQNLPAVAAPRNVATTQQYLKAAHERPWKDITWHEWLRYMLRMYIRSFCQEGGEALPADRVTVTPFIDAAAASKLDEHLERARGAFADSTWRGRYQHLFFVFFPWCCQKGRQALPADPATVIAFIDEMAASEAEGTFRLAAGTVRLYAASIAWAHRAARMPNPCNDEDVRNALRRMHRDKHRPPQKQAQGLTEDRVRQILEARGTRLRDLRNRAMLVMAYVTLTRRAELVALQVADLKTDPGGWATITIRRSKTDQEGQGAVVAVPADALRHVQAWIQAARITDGALFRAVRVDDRIGDELSPRDVARIFKTMAIEAGLPEADAVRVSGHSTRVGAAQDMMRYRESLAAIMQAGRWKTARMVGRYTARQSVANGAAMHVADQRIPF